MTAATPIKEALQSAAPIDSIARQRLVAHPPRCQELFLSRSQRRFFAAQSAGHRRRFAPELRSGAAPDDRRLTFGARQTGRFAGQGPELGSGGRGNRHRRARRTTATRCRKKDTRRNFCARSRICARARISSAPSFAYAAGWPSPFTNSFRSAASSTSIRQSSPAAIAKARGNCFA